MPRSVAAYWIVEGFATFIEEGRYDIERYEWSHFNPKASSIDIVAGLSKAGKLIDWEEPPGGAAEHVQYVVTGDGDWHEFTGADVNGLAIRYAVLIPQRQDPIHRVDGDIRI